MDPSRRGPSDAPPRACGPPEVFRFSAFAEGINLASRKDAPRKPLLVEAFGIYCSPLGRRISSAHTSEYTCTRHEVDASQQHVVCVPVHAFSTSCGETRPAMHVQRSFNSLDNLRRSLLASPKQHEMLFHSFQSHYQCDNGCNILF